MNKTAIRIGALLLLIIYCSICLSGCQMMRKAERDMHSDATETAVCATVSENDREDGGSERRISSRLYELLFGTGSARVGELKLVPSGDIFGIRIKEEYVSVTESDGSTPLIKGDKIVSIGGVLPDEPTDVSQVLEAHKGGSISAVIIRGGEKIDLTLIPKKTASGYVLGVRLRASSVGIGTLTYIDPVSGSFGGLGHGIYSDGGKTPTKLKSGIAAKAILGSIKKGEAGTPGELSGIVGRSEMGKIYKNDECGVFGVMENHGYSEKDAIPVSNKSEVTEGKAQMISTLQNGKKEYYDIEIFDIKTDALGSKCFKIRVLDPRLLSLSGGIVRGMSGSPIIQNGKLVGALTHVMVNDPTEGYGIFIENMLRAAEGVGSEAA